MARRIDSYTLRLFVSAARAGSIVRAAGQEHIAPSALSRRLADLEHAFGTPLLVRSPRGIALTDAGRMVVARGEKIDDDLQALVREVQTEGGEMRGTVRLYANMSAVIGFLPERLRSFMAAYPAVEVSLQEHDTRDVIRACLDDRADVGVGVDMPVPAGAGPGRSIDSDARERAASTQSLPPAAEDFPAIGSAQWKEGAFPTVEALRAMRTGMGKDQVRQLLSCPHFSEGLGGVRTWNYIFHFRTGSGPEYITCQYMVRFNDDVLTSGMYWNKPECARRVDPPAVKRTPVAAIAAPPRKVTLGADGPFRFDGGSLADLIPQGRDKLEALASEIKRDGRPLDSVAVTGHTDRLGTGSYNQALSMARASTVWDVLVRNGIDTSLIRVIGKGEAEPRVQCEQKKRDELIACLAPNRRVEIEVFGER